MVGFAGWKVCGAEGDRTPDLVNAIHALSQLSYSPGFIKEYHQFRLDNIDSLAFICKDGSRSFPRDAAEKSNHESTKIFHEGDEGLYSFIALSLCSLRPFFVTFVVKWFCGGFSATPLAGFGRGPYRSEHGYSSTVKSGQAPMGRKFVSKVVDF